MAEQKKDTFYIRLHLYDEEITVGIDRRDEEYFRLAAKNITDRYNAYAQRFKGQKNDHVIALMTMLDIAVQYQKERSSNDTMPYDNVLAKLTQEVEAALGSEK